MKVEKVSFHPYQIPLTTGQRRSGILINMTDEKGNQGWGDIAPLPKWSQETLKDALDQIHQKKQELLDIDWTIKSYPKRFTDLALLPSVVFGVESALLSLLSPLSEHTVKASILLIGSPQEILRQAEWRRKEGMISAKLKVHQLSFEEAFKLINYLKTFFHLRIDVNRAWSTADSLKFFSQFPFDFFDYVEEPFQNPHDLALFTHPLAIDESFPSDLTLKQMESFPNLKALIYKPTLQGGMVGCLSLQEWTRQRGIELVLSSSFESDIGLAHISSIAHRLSLKSPVGIGTYNFLEETVCANPLCFSNTTVHIPEQIVPKTLMALPHKN